MPNGFQGSHEDWKNLEAPLLRIDERLESFARPNGITITRNYHNWPERSLVWHAAGLRKLMQIYLENDQDKTFTFWICASADRGAQKYWKQKKLKNALPLEEIEKDMDALLVDGKKTLDGWNQLDLELAAGPSR